VAGQRNTVVEPDPEAAASPPHQVGDQERRNFLYRRRPEPSKLSTGSTYDDNLAGLLDVGVEGRTLRVQLEPDGRVEDDPIPRAEVTVRRLERSAWPAAPPSTSPARWGTRGCGGSSRRLVNR
jgi:hypothetical protein